MTEIILILFLICMVIQVLFHQWIFRGLLSSDNLDLGHDGLKSVSILIAARNEAENLRALIEVLKKQDHPNYEVIIINDRSTDETLKVYNDTTLDHKDFQLLNIDDTPSGWDGKKHALYQGIQAAKNEILLFTDGDCLPKSTEWVSQVARKFQSGTDLVLGFSPYDQNNGWLNRFIQFETLFTGLQYLGLAQKGSPYMGVGRNWAIRKSTYDLDFLRSIANTTGGDDDLMINHLATKTNTAIITDPLSQTTSKPEKSWSSFFKQKIRHLSVGSHYHKKDKTLLAVFTLAFLFGWLFFFALLVSAINPYLILATFGLRSLSFYSIFARIGRKFDVPPILWALPVLDLGYSIYYPVVGIRALSTKNIKWK